MRNSGHCRLGPIREDAHGQHSPLGLGGPGVRLLVGVNALRFVIAGPAPAFWPSFLHLIRVPPACHWLLLVVGGSLYGALPKIAAIRCHQALSSGLSVNTFLLLYGPLAADAFLRTALPASDVRRTDCTQPH